MIVTWNIPKRCTHLTRCKGNGRRMVRWAVGEMAGECADCSSQEAVMELDSALKTKTTPQCPGLLRSSGHGQFSEGGADLVITGSVLRGRPGFAHHRTTRPEFSPKGTMGQGGHGRDQERGASRRGFRPSAHGSPLILETSTSNSKDVCLRGGERPPGLGGPVPTHSKNKSSGARAE